MKKTIIDLFENSVKQYPDNPFLWEKTKDAFEPTTYKEVHFFLSLKASSGVSLL